MKFIREFGEWVDMNPTKATVLYSMILCLAILVGGTINEISTPETQHLCQWCGGLTP